MQYNLNHNNISWSFLYNILLLPTNVLFQKTYTAITSRLLITVVVALPVVVIVVIVPLVVSWQRRWWLTGIRRWWCLSNKSYTSFVLPFYIFSFFLFGSCSTYLILIMNCWNITARISWIWSRSLRLRCSLLFPVLLRTARVFPPSISGTGSWSSVSGTRPPVSASSWWRRSIIFSWSSPVRRVLRVCARTPRPFTPWFLFHFFITSICKSI